MEWKEGGKRMTNRGTAKRTRMRLKRREYTKVNGKTVNKWVDPVEEREKNKIPHAERHPNDITIGINLLKKQHLMDKQGISWYPTDQQQQEMDKATDAGATVGEVKGSVRWSE
tara:strand:- start:51 stop:389 length:339 start_codon:yes stop_codon:yes gene_type:complete